MAEGFQMYPEYKDSGIEWIGMYPNNWELTRVKFESYVKARVGWHGLKSDDFTEEGPYLVTGSDFIGPSINWNNCYHCDSNRYNQDPYIQLKNGDLLITKDGTIGKVALVSELVGKATLNSGVFVVRPLSNRYTSQFYFWLLQSRVFKGFVDYIKVGSTIAHLYQDTFVNFQFSLPSYNEQCIISRFLYHETAKIDTLIEKQQQLIQLLKEKRQAVISHAVTKGLNPDAPMRDTGVEWLGEVPEPWKIVRLSYLSPEVTVGIVVTPAKYYVESGIPCLRSLNIRAGYIQKENFVYITEESNDLLSKSTLYRDDIVVVRTGQPGTAAIVDNELDGSNCIDLIIIRKTNQLIPKFLEYQLNSECVKNQVGMGSDGAIQQHFNVEVAKSLQIMVPSLEDQGEIVEYLDIQKEKFEKLESKAEQQIALLLERRIALISAAVTGKIDVRDWQSPDQK